MKAQLSPQDHYYFVDATHPTHNPVMGYSWAVRGQRRPIPTNTARQRLNILGAYNPLLHTYVGFETPDNINAISFIHLIDQLQAHQPDGQIILICDNARYQHARLVRDHLQAHPRVKIIYLPPYSPNLNLIERLWGFMKKQILQTYYPTFADFRHAISSFFQHLGDYTDQLQSLMTENFTILNSV